MRRSGAALRYPVTRQRPLTARTTLAATAPIMSRLQSLQSPGTSRLSHARLRIEVGRTVIARSPATSARRVAIRRGDRAQGCRLLETQPLRCRSIESAPTNADNPRTDPTGSGTFPLKTSRHHTVCKMSCPMRRARRSQRRASRPRPFCARGLRPACPRHLPKPWPT